MRLLSSVKQRLVPAGIAPRVIHAGPFRGLKMDLDLRNQTQVYLGLFEREVHPWVTELSRGIHTAIDIGSAQGEYLLYFLKRTPAVQVLGFEPDETCWPALRRNLAHNALTGDPRLSLSNQFIGAQDGPRHVSLNSLVSRISGPCLVKLDVDGQEANILAGASQFLAQSQARLIVETHSEQLERDVIGILENHGYHCQIITQAWWRRFVPEHRPGPQNRWLVARRLIQ
ncbi:MAG: FkbM family methyltransferase [Bryobacteraceae bacterium]|nr:FkbM family methyltransferase [Bryobacteraceae bacterium]